MDDFARRYRLIGFALLVLVTLGAALLVLKPFYPALLWATVLGVLTAPFNKRLRQTWSANWAAFWTTMVTLACVGVPMLIVGIAVYAQASVTLGEMAASAHNASQGPGIDGLLSRVDDVIKPVVEKLGITGYSSETWVGNNKDSIVQSLKGPVSQAAKGAVTTCLTLVFAFLTLFFIHRDGHLLRKPALELIPLPPEKSAAILTRLAETIRAVFVGVVLVAIIQGAIAGVAYAVAGVPNAIMWCIATMILCTIPLLGAPFIYIPLSLSLFASGKVWQAFFLLGVGFVIVSQIDNILKPIFIGARTALHPMAVFFSLLGGVLILGPIGIMAGPMLLTVILALSEVLREMLRGPEHEEPEMDEGAVA
jgi:predicted PurR-regulated permease PerM